MNWDAQVGELNDPYQLMADGRRGYMEAAERAKSARSAEILMRLSRQREGMEKELGDAVRRFKRDDHTQEGTLKGVLPRVWMEITTALGKADDHNMVEECARGERYLLERLDAVIGDEGIAPSSKALLMEQRGMVIEDLAQVEQLRSVLAAVAG